MPLEASYIPAENRLDLTFEGNVDITVSEAIFEICRGLRPDLMYCIIDLSHAKRVFASGVALLQLLHCHLVSVGASVVILSDQPEVREHIPMITRRPAYPVPTRYQADPSIAPRAECAPAFAA